MSDNPKMSNKSDKAPGKATEDDATNAEFLKFVMIVFERQNPGFPIQGWADIAEKANYSVATSKQLWARLRDQYLQQMKDNVPVAPVIKPRKKRARVIAEDDETPVPKKNKGTPKSTSTEPHANSEHDSSDDSPVRAVAKRVGKTSNKSRVSNSKDKGKAVAASSPVPAAATSAASPAPFLATTASVSSPIPVPAAAPSTISVHAPVTRDRKNNRRAIPYPEEDIEDDEDDGNDEDGVLLEGDGTGRPLLFPNLPVPSQQHIIKKKDNQEKDNKDADSAEIKTKQRRQEEKEKKRREEKEEEEEMREAARALMSLRYGHC
ncbi:hypothetical protein PG987_015592 [Apiospora arundinis]